MFCVKCGKEIQEGWKICPSCGTQVVKKEPEENTPISDIRDDLYMQGMTQEETLETQLQKKTIQTRLLLKILAIIAMVCFFCPLCLVSCSGQEILSISGTDMAFGFTYMNEEMEGNILFGLILLFPFISFLCSFGNVKKMSEGEEGIGIFSDLFAISAIMSLAGAIVPKLIVEHMNSVMNENGLEVTACTALYIMTLANVAAVIVGAYMSYSISRYMEQNKPDIMRSGEVMIACKCFVKIVVIGLTIAGIAVTLFGVRLRPSTVSEENIDREYSDIMVEPYGEGSEEDIEDIPESKETDIAQQEQEVSDEQEYIFPDSDSRYLSEEEVRGMDTFSLSYGRNEIFARHGYIFNTPEIQQYFESMSWYEGIVTPDEFNADAVFNDFEKENIELIKSIEDELG